MEIRSFFFLSPPPQRLHHYDENPNKLCSHASEGVTQSVTLSSALHFTLFSYPPWSDGMIQGSEIRAVSESGSAACVCARVCARVRVCACSCVCAHGDILAKCSRKRTNQMAE